ncbi:MAG: hypothetical protein N2C14_23165 [Planctomycetales bacterium]
MADFMLLTTRDGFIFCNMACILARIRDAGLERYTDFRGIAFALI